MVRCVSKHNLTEQSQKLPKSASMFTLCMSDAVGTSSGESEKHDQPAEERRCCQGGQNARRPEGTSSAQAIRPKAACAMGSSNLAKFAAAAATPHPARLISNSVSCNA